MDATLDRAPLEGAGFVEEADGDLLALAVALRRAPCERTATRLTLAVDRLPATEASARALALVAEELKPVSQADADGRWCFEVVVRRWLDLGYPWALEVPPEYLAVVQRRTAESSSGGWAAVALVGSTLAGLWYLLLVGTLFGTRRALDAPAMELRLEEVGLGLVAVVCLGWLVELVRTMAMARLDDREAIALSARRLARLGLSMWAAPLATVTLAFWSPPLGFMMGAFFAPLSISGAAARLAARRLARLGA
jgi:hypothetical protein